MKLFIHEDFLLQTEAARRLYHDYAEEMPIIDYHCHLPPVEIAEDKRWENITQAWLYDDHYKWRALRSNGVEERYCTGDADDRKKFDKLAETMPYLLRNPIYHWTHLELKRYFGISELLSPKTSDKIWEATRAKLAGGLSARALMHQSKVLLVCTTDDPADSLEHHHAVKADEDFDVQVLPTWRPDSSMAIDHPKCWNKYIDRLSQASGIEINSYRNLIEALRKRHDAFHEAGCRLSDHDLQSCYAVEFTETEVAKAFVLGRTGKPVDEENVRKFKFAMLLEFGRMDAEKGWTKQLHMGAMRNNNSKMFDALGQNAGYDSISDRTFAEGLSGYFDQLNSEGNLPQIIMYNLNPRDNEVLVSMTGNFQEDPVPGRMQFGSGWWFMDQKDGMTRQIEALSQLGLLSRFVGMLTDSRSFLSFTRHEYFRRILCGILGRDMEEGTIPPEYDLVGGMVKDICYYNARRYFGFKNLP